MLPCLPHTNVTDSSERIGSRVNRNLFFRRTFRGRFGSCVTTRIDFWTSLMWVFASSWKCVTIVHSLADYGFIYKLLTFPHVNGAITYAKLSGVKVYSYSRCPDVSRYIVCHSRKASLIKYEERLVLEVIENRFPALILCDDFPRKLLAKLRNRRLSRARFALSCASGSCGLHWLLPSTSFTTSSLFCI